MLVDYIRIHYVCLTPRCTKENKMRILCEDGHRIVDSEKQSLFSLKNIFFWKEMILNIYLNAYDVATQPVVQLRDCILIKWLGAEYFRLGYSIVPYERKKNFFFEWVQYIVNISCQTINTS